MKRLLTILLVSIGVTAGFVLAPKLMTARTSHEESQLTITVPDQLDLYIEQLAFLESHGHENVQIIDSNGEWSRGCLQFQDETWKRYSAAYHQEGDIMDCAAQKRLARQILLAGGWRNWYNSVSRLGGRAEIPMLGVQEARFDNLLGQSDGILGG